MKQQDVASSEANLWQWLLKAHAESDFSEGLHIERIENMVGVGNPDVTGCLYGRAFDIELKTAHRPARATTAVIPVAKKDPYIRPAQKNWHRVRWLAGGSCFFLIQVGRDALYLLPGKCARLIEGMTEQLLEDHSVLRELGRQPSPLNVIRRAATYRSPS